MLAPFKVAQEALEGDKYVNLSLLSLIIEKLRLKLYDFLAAIDSEAQPQLHTMLSDMLQVFESIDGATTVCTAHRQSEVIEAI